MKQTKRKIRISTKLIKYATSYRKIQTFINNIQTFTFYVTKMWNNANEKESGEKYSSQAYFLKDPLFQSRVSDQVHSVDDVSTE